MIPGISLQTNSQDFYPHWLLHPKVYVAPYTPTPLTIDGTLDKWSSVPWSTYFGDIIGGNSNILSNPPSPECSTRIKMMWDEQYLYILGYIESSKEVIATYKERNSPIFHQDCDFEVFVDPNSSCHGYKELEMNAFNTVWNLMLSKPYADGGCEHSGRIAQPGDSLYYDVQGQKTCVQVLEGKINDSTSTKNTWIVEIAMLHEDTMVQQKIYKKPRLGDTWRINFSRVEEKGNINWTWQPQIVWNPEQHVHEGQINMHLPDAWGYVRFGPEMSKEEQDDLETFGEVSQQDILTGKGDTQWPGKLVAMNFYYAQHYYRQLHGHFATSLRDFEGWVDPLLWKPFQDSIVSWYADVSSFQMSLLDTSQGALFQITHDRLLTVTSPPSVTAFE